MIQYKSDFFGFKTLLIWNGSALYRAFIPATLSTGVLLLYHFTWMQRLDGPDVVENPVVISVFIGLFAFLLTFRLNYSYQRYWEATSMVHHMSSKWLDSAICLASVHYQSKKYDAVRPLSFGTHPKIRNETRERERLAEQKTQEETERRLSMLQEETKKRQGSLILKLRRRKGGRNKMADATTKPPTSSRKAFKPNKHPSPKRGHGFANPPPNYLHSKICEESNPPAWRASFSVATGDGSEQRFMDLTGMETTVPSLFLQEAAHLYSLLSAVSMSALRADLEGAQSPLTEYIPGTPFPPVNPDELGSDIKFAYYESFPLWTFIYFILGLDRTPRQRTLYNAARPFRVIGGVSDAEAELLQKARGPYAEMALCNMWLKEFISREYLNGSTGKVGPPIIGRVYQFISDGVSAYNQCRKIAFVPFPFPHDQILVFTSFLTILLFPVLYVSFVQSLPAACILNFITFLCFKGIHEVARELSNPFFTVPNDLPLNNFHSQYNEALITMYAGFHPDSWRKDEEEKEEQGSLHDNAQEVIHE